MIVYVCMMMMMMLLLLSYDADSGWNVTRALSSYLPAIAVAAPGATAMTRHSVIPSAPQHCAVTQVSASNTCQQTQTCAHTDVAMIQPATQKLTEQGRLVRLNRCNYHRRSIA